MEMTTAGKLTPGTRVYVTMDLHTPAAFASGPDGGRAAVVTANEKAGRRRLIRTDLGDIEAGATTKVVLAPPVDPDPTPDPDPVPPPAAPETATVTATVNLDAAGRLTADSRVTVCERSTVVPKHAGYTPDGMQPVPGAALAPVRLRAALTELGYEPASRWTLKDGTAVCQVRPAA
ncbi:hypothetical protein GA0070616_4573 [Micromonospora nigra]|uniref:Uncharacterized protein n=1 Tax=Micromonospora nigra TaxID=145857 RepID=A0A1C6STL7_9ACTN|nr:hypothetical protein [Micromonospora nigra]SCL32860.1 hypothetical protein GA0070616_4573 [Micromonospora nigra]